MKTSLITCSTLVLLAFGFGSSQAPCAPQQTTEPYELQVWFGAGAFDTSDHQPQIRIEIQLETLFFARRDAPDAASSSTELYVASGVLHPPRDGKFVIDYALLEWFSPTSNITDGPNKADIELNKPYSIFSSGGVVRGYVILLTKPKKS